MIIASNIARILLGLLFGFAGIAAAAHKLSMPVFTLCGDVNGILSIGCHNRGSRRMTVH
jgi:hypothetical protein